MEFSVSGVKIFYLDEGEGQPVVFIHGFPLNHTNWLPVMQLLAGEGHFVALDLRGHGQSDAPASIYSMSRFAEDVLHLLDHLKIERAILVGHSMGGYVCLRFARDYPTRLAGLGLVATQARPDTADRKTARHDSAKAVAAQGPIFAANSLPQKYTARPELQQAIRDIILSTPANGIIGSLLGMAERDDSTPYLAKIQAPTVVIAGAEDALIPTEVTREIAELIPGAEYVEVVGSGHMPMMESPETVAAALRKIIQKNN